MSTVRCAGAREGAVGSPATSVVPASVTRARRPAGIPPASSPRGHPGVRGGREQTRARTLPACAVAASSPRRVTTACAVVSEQPRADVRAWGQARSASSRRVRRRVIAAVWICEMRDSVTPSTRPISASVMLS